MNISEQKHSLVPVVRVSSQQNNGAVAGTIF